MAGSGTKDDPWQLTTPPGTSDYTMYRDDAADPPQIVCQVGSTKLTYDARAIDDLHALLAVMTERGRLLLENVAPTHVNGVRDHIVDLATPEDFAALGRVMNAVADHLIAGHPEMEMR